MSEQKQRIKLFSLLENNKQLPKLWVKEKIYKYVNFEIKLYINVCYIMVERLLYFLMLSISTM
jgi:hypothetical protein